MSLTNLGANRLAARLGAHHQTDEIPSATSCMFLLIRHFQWKVSLPILGPTVALS